MLNLIIRSVAINAAYYTGEKLFQAGVKAAGAFKDSREARRAPSVAECLNGSPGAPVAILVPFRVTVAEQFEAGAVGACCHDIYAVDADEALQWAQHRYGTKCHIIVEGIH